MKRPLRLFYFLRQEELKLTPAQLAEVGFTDVIVPLAEPWDFFRGEGVTPAALIAHLQALRAKVGPTVKLWVSIRSTFHKRDAADERRTFPLWKDAATWDEWFASLRTLAIACKIMGVVGILLDSECYGKDYPRQTPGKAWTWSKGVGGRYANRYVRTILDAYPACVIGHHVLHKMEKDLPGYAAWWRAINRMHPETVTFILDATNRPWDFAATVQRDLGGGKIAWGNQMQQASVNSYEGWRKSLVWARDHTEGLWWFPFPDGLEWLHAHPEAIPKWGAWFKRAAQEPAVPVGVRKMLWKERVA